MPQAWLGWWKARGEAHLTLLLWALWNPIGPVPLDEYEDCSPRVATLLREHHDEDSRIAPADTDIDDEVQRWRNQSLERAEVRLATLLGQLRQEEMGMDADPETDRRAASTLLDWYEWEMAEAGLSDTFPSRWRAESPE